MKLIACLWLLSTGWGYTQLANWKSYTGDTYTIQYPPTWTPQEPSEDMVKLGIRFSIISPAEKKGDDFYENMNLVANKLETDGVTLESYAESAPALWKDILVGYKNISHKTIITHNGPMLVLIFSGKLDKQPLVWQQYVILKNNMVYIMSYTAKKKSYKLFEDIFKQMADSFIIH